MRRMRVTILGAGALARALASALPARAVDLTIAARRPAEARRIARVRRGTTAAPSFAEALAATDVVLLAVDDRALSALARKIASLRPSWRGVTVLHAAGALTPQVLAPLARRGASTGVLHPIVPLHRSGGAPLKGAPARIAGSPKAIASAKRLAALTGLLPLARSRAERDRDVDLHHAAAALCTGDVLALLTLAEDAFEASGVSRTAARRAAIAAATATIRRLALAGPEATLSGPVVRGDVPRLLRHLRALARVHPAAAPAHRALTQRLADLAGAGEIASALRGPGRSRTV
jgi:predicted short-subunit dehydrogenase-like oxidoreductase (DUF2520 family)